MGAMVGDSEGACVGTTVGASDGAALADGVAVGRSESADGS